VLLLACNLFHSNGTEWVERFRSHRVAKWDVEEAVGSSQTNDCFAQKAPGNVFIVTPSDAVSDVRVFGRKTLKNGT
jgi:hypothetical protein